MTHDQNSVTDGRRSFDGTIDRRDVLKLTGGAFVGATALPGLASADSDVSISVFTAAETNISPGDKIQLNVTATNNTDTSYEMKVYYHSHYPCGCPPAICDAIAPEPPIAVDNIHSRSDDGGTWSEMIGAAQQVFVWEWETVSAQSSVNPSVTFEVPEDKDPGDYSFGFIARLGVCDHEEPDDLAGEVDDSVTVTIEESNPQFEITAQSSTGSVAPGETTKIYPLISNTGDAAGDVSAYFQAATDSTDHNADFYSDDFTVVSHDDDGGNWEFEGWSWTDVGAGEIREPSVELEVKESLAPGDYTFAIDAIQSGGSASPDDTATATVTVEGKEFDPDVDGFGFYNWAGSDPDNGDFDPDHDHNGLDDAWRQEAVNKWAPDLNALSSVPLPDIAVEAFVDDISEKFTDGAFTTGHCYGMVFGAKKYYEDGLPSGISADSVSEIPQPTGEYSALEDDIDSIQNQQALDSDVIVQGNALSPPDVPFKSDATIDFQSEYQRITTRIDEEGIAPVGLGQSSDRGGLFGGSLHQVLAYDYDDNWKELHVYDPNLPGGNSPSNYVPPEKINFDTSGETWTMFTYRTGGTVYDRLGLIGQSRADTAGMLLGGAEVLGSIITNLVSNAADGLVSIVGSPSVEIDATGPDGEQLDRPSDPIDGTPPERIAYSTEASTGDFQIDVTGTADGEYSVEVQGSVPSGGFINDSIEGTISTSETKSLTATVPEDEGDEGGFVSDWYEPYVNENNVVETEGLNQAIGDYLNGELRSSRLNAVIQSYLSNEPIDG